MLVSDFQSFEPYDLDTRQEVQFKLQDLPKNVQAFNFIFGGAPRVFKDQDPGIGSTTNLLSAACTAFIVSSGTRGAGHSILTISFR